MTSHSVRRNVKGLHIENVTFADLEMIMAIIVIQLGSYLFTAEANYRLDTKEAKYKAVIPCIIIIIIIISLYLIR
jgi:MFS-type transporter involved in bile tolerance (Atg22 family)